MSRMGRPRTHVFKKGERLHNSAKGKTRWRYISEADSRHDKRRVNVVCDCGSIHTRYLSEILHGNSTGCIKCMRNMGGGQKGPRKGSLRWHSLNIGKTVNYFINLKRENHEKYSLIARLGLGDLTDGYHRMMEIERLNDEIMNVISQSQNPDELIERYDEFINQLRKEQK